MPPSTEGIEGMYEKAEGLMKEKFGNTVILPRPKRSGPSSEVEMTEILQPPIKKSFTEMRAEMYTEPPPMPESYAPSLPMGIDPSTIPPEIQEIIKRRPDLLSQALQQSKMKASRQGQEGDVGGAQGRPQQGQLQLQPDLLSPGIDTRNTNVPLEHTKVSKVQANMLTNQRGYAERFAGMAAAAELQGIKIAKPRKNYEDDEDQSSTEDDDVGLLNSNMT
jgi:hypothetical protein